MTGHRFGKPSARRILQEAMAGVVQRSSRSAMTVLGIALGVASFIAVLGVTSSANAQIGTAFLNAEATQIKVAPSGNVVSSAPLYPADAEKHITAIEGVASVGRWWMIPGVSVSTLPSAVAPVGKQLPVLAVTPGYWTLVGAEVSTGRRFDEFLSDKPVAVLGAQIAEGLGITDIRTQPVILLDNQRLSVIGIVTDAVGSSAALTSVTIPADYARAHFSPPGQKEAMIIATDRGASAVVAGQVALALDPWHPESYLVVPPPPPTVVRDRVSSSTQTLFYSLAGIGVLVSGVGIANVSLIGVIARSREIALRRSLGALPRHIATQFLLESAVRGLLGGAIGTAIAVVAVTLVGVSQGWTVVIEPWSLLAGPIMGITIGMLAGLHPSLKATRIQPADAFRQ